ncbi:LOW QUALITY PROTEIN: ATP-binding cassette sub-family B member 10, mitochondrial [Caloenas nicobarica]|uniref:LOW QUALITY PROTEIN: ATP-binding cassette sub-family B member 10, mitochondrial n=1 Tax=Caloenas nicobarica TaxID=187106 RepID=UPI0032B7532D
MGGGGGSEAPPPAADPRGADRLQQQQHQPPPRLCRAGRMAGYAPRLPWLLPLLRRAAPPPWARAAGGAAGLRAPPRPAGRCGPPPPSLPPPPPGAPSCSRLLLLPPAAPGSAPRSLSAAAGAEPPAPPRGPAGVSPRSQARRLLALAHPERWRLTAAVGFLTVSSVITMSAPFFLGKVIDIIYTNPSEDFTDSLTSLCALLSGIFLCGAAANATRVYLMQTAGQRIVKRLRTTMFSSVLKQETAFFDKTRTGELINRLSSDTALLGRSVTENLSDGLRAGAQASVGVGMMFFVSPSLAAFVLSVVPPLAVMAVIYGRYLRKLTKMTQDSLAEATQLAEERIGNIRTVRAFGQEVAEMEKYTNKVDYVLQLAKKEAVARAGFFGATGLSGNLIVLSVLYKGGLLMGSAYMTVGELSSFLMYAFWVGISIGGLSSFYSELMKGLGAGGRLWELIERKPQLPFNEGITLSKDTFRGALEFNDVEFAYPTRPETSIFKDFSLSIPAGSVMALVGPSGTGKSTIVSLLLRLYDPISGTITVDGFDIRQLNPLWFRTKIGTVSQEPILFSCSIAENIAYGAEDPSTVTAEEIQKVAEIANAASFIRDFPKGFDTVVGEKGILLSGGQKQRIAIARALLKNPKILLLDEATSALDAENEYLVQEALDRLMEGRTVLIIAHRLSTIQNADFVAVLGQGKILECGKHEDLLANPNGLFRKLMQKQAFLQNSDTFALDLQSREEDVLKGNV